MVGTEETDGPKRCIHQHAHQRCGSDWFQASLAAWPKRVPVPNSIHGFNLCRDRTHKENQTLLNSGKSRTEKHRQGYLTHRTGRAEVPSEPSDCGVGTAYTVQNPSPCATASKPARSRVETSFSAANQLPLPAGSQRRSSVRPRSWMMAMAG